MDSTAGKNSIRFSIIIPICDNAGIIAETLKSIRANDMEGCELIVVDDRSGDGSAEKAAAFADVTISMPERRGPARARNIAAGKASGEYLLFTDSDVLWPPDLVDKFNAVIDSNPGCAGVSTFATGEPLNRGFWPKCHELSEGALAHYYLKGRPLDDFEYITTRCGAVRRDLFLRAGGFDERYLVPSIEDFEFSVRFNRDNRFIYVPDSGVRHYWATSPRGILLRLYRNSRLWAKTMYGDAGFTNVATTRERAAANLTGAASFLTLLFAALDARLLAIPAALTAATAIFNRRFIGYARGRGGLMFSLAFAVYLQASSLAVTAGALSGMISKNKSDKWHEIKKR